MQNDWTLADQAGLIFSPPQPALLGAGLVLGSAQDEALHHVSLQRAEDYEHQESLGGVHRVRGVHERVEAMVDSLDDHRGRAIIESETAFQPQDLEPNRSSRSFSQTWNLVCAPDFRSPQDRLRLANCPWP